MSRASARAGIGIVAGLVCVLLLLPAGAQANEYGYVFKELFGSAAKPSFTNPNAMAVDPATNDLLVLDLGAKTITRFKPNGEAANFSALGSNAIDGKTGADKTPQEALNFPTNGRQTQLAVDGACALHEPPLAGSACETFDPANGDIYVAQSGNLIDAFSSAGEYLGQITEFTSNEVQQLELAGLSQGEEFSLSGLPGSCSGSTTPEIPYSPVAVDALEAALEAQCGGGSLGIKSKVTLRVEFTGELGDADQRQLSCGGGRHGVDSCSVSTLVPGDASHNEVQQATLEGFSEGEEFTFENLPESSEACEIGQTENVPLTTALAANARKALEHYGRCGPNFSVSFAGAGAAIDFAGPLGAADQAQLSCAASGIGACSLSTSQAGGQPRPFGNFGGGLAVDPAGDLYVAEGPKSEIHKFQPISNAPYQAKTLTNFYSPQVAALAAGAGPSAGALFVTNFAELVKLDSSSGARRYVVERGAGGQVAVDLADGTVLSGNETGLNQYDASGATEATLLAQPAAFPPHAGEGGNLQSLAIDPASGALYLSRSGGANISVYERVILPEATSEAATALGPGEATLHGKVSAAGGPSASCQFEYITEAAFNAPLGQGKKNEFKGAQTAPCSPPGPFTGSNFEPVSATVEGLLPGTDYRFRVVATNKGGSSLERPGGEASLHFKTLGPAIAGEEASEIGETEATISAQVDPNGEATTYAVEYVSEAEYLQSGFNHALAEPTPPQSLGSGEEFLAVSRRLAGLDPGTAYRYRIAAANGAASVHGEERRFATYAVQPALLPDGRAYEKVTPSGKKGEPISPEQRGEIGSSCDGTNPCLPGGFEQKMPMQAAPDGESILYEGQPFAEGLAQGASQYLSRRSASGWDWESLSPPAQTGFWVDASADLSRGVLSQPEVALSPAAPVREGKAFENLYLRGEGEALVPLIGAEPPHRSPGGSNRFQIRYSGANAGAEAVGAMTHIVFEANDALTGAVPGIAPAAPTVAAGEECSVSPCNLYEWASGQLRLVNVAPGNAAALGGSAIGSGRLLETAPNRLEPPNTGNAVSADGRYVFFNSEETGRAYVRIGAEKTLQLAGLAKCKKSIEATERVCFLTASANGHRALLSNGQLDAINEAETTYGKAFDLTGGQEGFKGILGASADLSRIYFADVKALPGAEANAKGESPAEVTTGANLYYWHEGAVRFVGALTAHDNSMGFAFGDWRATSGDRSAQATPDGRYLTFMSKAPLTGYDNDTATSRCSGSQSGPACFEVFEYTAATGRLSCASCNPDGLRPLGESSLTRLSADGQTTPNHRQPESLPAEGEGRLFFESQDALSPHDKNGNVQDVYEWEPKGVGSCESEAAEGGCVYLISSGKSPTDATFLDATPSGNDAFFVDRTRLVPSDKDEQLDLYDARVGGGFEEPEPPAPCEGQACRGASPSAPGEAPSAGSASFAGPGNEKQPPACPKGTRRVARGGKSQCLKPHKKHKPRKRKRAKHDRGGSR